LNSEEILEKAKPFGALIAPSSLVLAALYLAGFSYRWSYYYNFGLQNIVFDFNAQSFLVTSIELIREPRNLLITAASLAGALVLVNMAMGFVLWAGRAKRPNMFHRIVLGLTRLLGLDNPLVTDAIRALVVIYVIYTLSASVGYARFKADVVNGSGNPLPVVTAIVDKGNGEELPLGCGKEAGPPLNVIGDAAAIRMIRETHRTCSLDDRVWRLLHRDDKSVYLFASEPAENMVARRPLTIVLPNTDNVTLIME
jgi:hypothetical protein